MGRLQDFKYYSDELQTKLDSQLEALQSELQAADQGSIIMLIATDLPLDARQLKRVAKRSVVGLAKTGSQLGTGSGDICLAFSSANQISHQGAALEQVTRFGEQHIDQVFDAAIEAVEDAILNSMLQASSVTGFENNSRVSLSSLVEDSVN